MENVKKLILCVLMPVLVSTTAVADIHYVNPGESIQAAIDAADPGDEIEVAPGTYTEAIDFIGKAIRLYSSGGPDVTTIDGSGHYHVAQCISGEDNNTILEGFTITGGNAIGSIEFEKQGGGMWNFNSSPTVTDCIFSGNFAIYRGGGMGNCGSSPTVTNCTFSGNTADFGGGMHNSSNSSPIVTNCTFAGNTANTGGGGTSNSYESSLTVTNCTFSGNTSIGYGGGMYNYKNNPTVTNCTFSSNNTQYGGGMFNMGSNPTVTNCTFSNNTATYGGGMLNDSASPTVTNCTFSGNSANNRGGGMFNTSGIPKANDCAFSGSKTNTNSGGMDNEGESNPTVTNCTFTGNTANSGGGMCNYIDNSPTVTNCILWGDTGSEIVGGMPIVTYSDVQGGTGETWFGEGCIDTDPMFADAEGRLLAFSPCLDAGNDAAVPPGVTTDLDGNPRIQGVCVDMGAFESDLNYMDPGWVFMIPDSPDFGYSLNEADLLYFYSFDFVQSLNLATGVWSIYRPIGLVYIDWPFYYELDTDTLMFALPPEIGLLVYHFSTAQLEVLPRIIP